MMNQEQLRRMISGKGFIAALDQSDRSTSQVKENDRVPSDSYPNEQKMHALHYACSPIPLQWNLYFRSHSFSKYDGLQDRR